MIPADMKNMLDQQDGVVLLDVREPAEYAQGFIPGAALLPVGTILAATSLQDLEARGLQAIAEQEGLASVQDASAVIVYCHSGVRSAHAVKKLEALGLENVYDGGGIISWPYGLHMPPSS